MRILNDIFYYLILYPFSRAPYFLLYVLADFLFILVYYVLGYRKKVVFENLRNSFPNKSTSELKKIRRVFYRHFCDVLIESLKAFTISSEMANKRMTHSNAEVFKELEKKNKSAVLISDHYGNWELFALTLAQQFPQKANAIYAPLKNPFWEEKMKSIRSRFGLNLVTIKNAKSLFSEKLNNPSVTLFFADQSPRNPKKAYWMKFMNQDTGIQFGAEKYAKEYNLAVVLGRISRVKRGYYHTDFSLLFEETKDLPHGIITEEYTKALEKQIQKEPAFYLWTHRRWKHKRPEGHVN